MSRHRFLARLDEAEFTRRTGRVTAVRPTVVEADGPDAPLGALCSLSGPGGSDEASAIGQVAAVTGGGVRLTLLTGSAELGGRVIALPTGAGVAVGDGFLGRAIDGLGRPIDGEGAITKTVARPLQPLALSPLERCSPRVALETGVRAIDGLLTMDHGQRIGIFAPAGVGKTTLLAQLLRQVAVDRCVICLVGERGREVENLWRSGLDDAARAKSVLVAATSDQSAAMRARACAYALSLAEHWRDEGSRVLLVLDSATRFAMALREIGLAAGEPPTVRGYTPSVFAAIPQLVERCGALRRGGSITAVFTILSESAENDDPVSEMMKSLLDGHILLSRALSEQGHYPAIDVPRSLSRLAVDVMPDPHRIAAKRVRSAISRYEDSKTLIETGLYIAGADAEIDAAIALRPAITAFLRQAPDERDALAATGRQLSAILGGRGEHVV